MWILAGASFVLLLCVVALDRAIRAHPGRKLEVRISIVLVVLSLLLLVTALVWRPATAVGLLLALTCANAFIAFQRSRAFREAAKVKAEAGFAEALEAPYEQFVNTFLSYLDRGEADALEFEFRQWRMEIRFKKGDQVIPVTQTPFHMLLQIKRLFDAATAKNAKTGEAKTRYVARGTLYEFLSEDIGGTLLRLRLLSKRPATAEETKAFDRMLSTVR